MFVLNPTMSRISAALFAAALVMAVGCGNESKKKRSSSKVPSSQVREPVSPTYPDGGTNPVVNVPAADWDGCGKEHYCDKGNGEISLPSSASSFIGGYSAEDIRLCMKTAAENKIRTYGPWIIDGASRQFNIGTQTIAIDAGTSSRVSGNYARIMMLNIQNFLGLGTVELMDPNTVYCIKSNSNLSAMKYRSCYPNNVVFIQDSQWLSANKYVVPMSCGGVPIWEQRYK